MNKVTIHNSRTGESKEVTRWPNDSITRLVVQEYAIEQGRSLEFSNFGPTVFPSHEIDGFVYSGDWYAKQDD